MDPHHLARSVLHVPAAVVLLLGFCALFTVSNAAAEDRFMECLRDCPKCLGGVSRHLWKYEKSPSGKDNVYLRIKRRWQEHCAATMEGPATTRHNEVVKRNIADWHYECEMSSSLVVWNDWSRKPSRSTDLRYEIDFAKPAEHLSFSVNGKPVSQTLTCTFITEQEAADREPGVKH